MVQIVSYTDYSSKLSLWLTAKLFRPHLPKAVKVGPSYFLSKVVEDGHVEIIKWLKYTVNRNAIFIGARYGNLEFVSYLYKCHHKKYSHQLVKGVQLSGSVANYDFIRQSVPTMQVDFELIVGSGSIELLEHVLTHTPMFNTVNGWKYYSNAPNSAMIKWLYQHGVTGIKYQINHKIFIRDEPDFILWLLDLPEISEEDYIMHICGNREIFDTVFDRLQDKEKLLKYAVGVDKENRIYMVTKILEHVENIDISVYSNIIKSNDLELIKLTIDKVVIDVYRINEVLITCNLEIIKLVTSDIDLNLDLSLNHAVNDREIVDYLVSKGYQIKKSDASRVETLEMAKYLHSLGADLPTTYNACLLGDMEFLEYLLTNGAKIDRESSYAAGKSGHLEILKRLAKCTKITADAIHYAAENKHKEIVEWCIENGYYNCKSFSRVARAYPELVGFK